MSKSSGRGMQSRSAARRSPAAEERLRDAERSRARLLDAALEEFARRGYAGTRVQDVAARAGVNAQLISYYFGGKEGLYQALQESWLRTEAAFADRDLPFDELISAYLRAVLEDPRPARLFLWSGLGEDPDDAASLSPAPNAAADIADIQRRQAAGEIAADLDPAMFQIALMGLLLAPLALPQIVREYTGVEATDPTFMSQYIEQVRIVLRHLGG